MTDLRLTRLNVVFGERRRRIDDQIAVVEELRRTETRLEANGCGRQGRLLARREEFHP